MKDIETEKLESLEKALKELPKQGLESNKKLMMKNSIMSQLNAPVIRYIRNLNSQLKFGPDIRALIKERVFALIEKTQQKRFLWERRLRFAAVQFVGVLVLVCMAFYMFGFLSINTNVVMAETFTTLDSYSGEVSLEREGEFIELYEGMEIYEQDKLVTGTDGKLSVKFFDNSLSRLGVDSEIVINKLFKPRQSSVKSHVEISVLEGVVWSKVINLVEENSFFVVEALDVSVSAKRAAFNVEIIGDEVEINVFKNVVEVKTLDGVEETVVTGQTVVLNETQVQIQVKKIDDQEKESDWVVENLDSDEEYLAEVEEEILEVKKEIVGMKEDEEFKAGNSLKEQTVLFLTFDDVKQKQMELELAEKNFIAAEIRLEEENLNEKELEEIQKAFKLFEAAVNDFYTLIQRIRESDERYANELELYLEEKILIHKKNLSLVLPDSPSYQAKEVINELELSTAKDEEEALKLKTDQGLTKLSDAEDMIDRGDVESAKEIVDEYKEDVDEVIEVIDSLDSYNDDEVLLKEELVKDVTKGFKLLDKMEEIVSDEEIIELADRFEEETIGQEIIEEMKEDEIVEIEAVVIEQFYVDEEYGIRIEGDKPLSPLLNF
jgi:hypothetical protein